MKRHAGKNGCAAIVGFTLVELLVVVAVLTLLASFLLPALNKAIGMAHDVECLNQMRQLAQYQQEYCNDNHGVFQTGRYNIAFGDNRCFWQDLLMPYAYPGNNTGRLKYKKKLTYGGHSYYPGKTFFSCPRLKGDTWEYLATNISSNYYASNYTMLGIGFNSNLLSWRTSDYYTGEFHAKKITGIARPSMSIMMMDMMGNTSTDTSASSSRLTYGTNQDYMWRKLAQVPPRHSDGKALNVAFADGHSATILFDKLPISKAKDTDAGSWLYR
ncbi:MAG: prepilin-type N-terminal cleavage/methylation domain-containing protein [Planctomycetes bacterium]|nr:prepilin-type N-terminal cleavage/methylation domain-containing protein [Planctomycetota bacterium]